jgi:thiol-disulfide isomerase/thioredoxin
VDYEQHLGAPQARGDRQRGRRLHRPQRRRLGRHREGLGAQPARRRPGRAGAAAGDGQGGGRLHHHAAAGEEPAPVGRAHGAAQGAGVRAHADARGLLSKQRILEIYLNNVEWGEGVFGAQAAARHYFRVDAAQLGPSRRRGWRSCCRRPSASRSGRARPMWPARRHHRRPHGGGGAAHELQHPKRSPRRRRPAGRRGRHGVRPGQARAARDLGPRRRRGADLPGNEAVEDEVREYSPSSAPTPSRRAARAARGGAAAGCSGWPSSARTWAAPSGAAPPRGCRRAHRPVLRRLQGAEIALVNLGVDYDVGAIERGGRSIDVLSVSSQPRLGEPVTLHLLVRTWTTSAARCGPTPAAAAGAATGGAAAGCWPPAPAHEQDRSRRRCCRAACGRGRWPTGIGWAWRQEHLPRPTARATTALVAALPAARGRRTGAGRDARPPLVLNFWATWCPPCIKEMPALDRFREPCGTRWEVVGLAVDGPTPVREFLQRVPVSFPIGLAGFGGADLGKRLGNQTGGLPFTVVLRQPRPRGAAQAGRNELRRTGSLGRKTSARRPWTFGLQFAPVGGQRLGKSVESFETFFHGTGSRIRAAPAARPTGQAQAS